MGEAARSGIGRRRGAAKPPSMPPLLVAFAAASFLTLFAFATFGYYMAFAPSPSATPIAMSHGGLRLRKEARGRPPTGADGRPSEDNVTSLDMILRGDLHLVDVVPHGIRPAERSADGAKYRGVTARFCKLDWEKYKRDPPAFPMFKILVAASGCDKAKNTVSMDLAKVVQAARENDEALDAQKETGANHVHVMPPTGFVFHESRVGSTLVANSLTAMDPDGHRVYSESHPINDALKACEHSRCDMDVSAGLFRDVVYLLGRTSSPTEKRMFFKVSSIGSKRIRVVQKAFPSVPWIFVYRDPVQTMMSHLPPDKHNKAKALRKPFMAVCLRAKRRPEKDLLQLVQRFGGDIDKLSEEEFCAAHLATLCESALKAIKKSDGKGAAVEYEGLVEKLTNSVIPNHFGVEVDESSRQRILDVSKYYSKSKGGGREWEEDSELKDRSSTPEIRDASDKFLSPSYFELRKYQLQ